MRDSVKLFFSGLHTTHLKLRGYSKVRNTFSRTMSGYTERVQFQGSSWNDSQDAWRFYINFGIEFHDLPCSPRKDFSHTHCWTRIENIVCDAPPHFDLPELDPPAFAVKIVSLLEQASQNVGQSISRLRQLHDVGNLYPTRWRAE